MMLDFSMRSDLMRIVVYIWTAMLLANSVKAQTQQETLSFTSPRPIRDAIVEYEKKYGWVITYEDPRFEFPGDMEDRAQTARQLGKTVDPDKTFRIPKTRTVSVTYDRPIDARDATVRSKVLQKLIDAYSQTDGSTFRLESSTTRLHIVPALVRDKSGQLQYRQPTLDTIISLSDQSRDGMQFLAALCAQVSTISGFPVRVGTVPMNALLRHRTESGFENQSARMILEEFLNSLPGGTQYTWRLLYGEVPPLGLGYVLNINSVKSVSPPAPAAAAKQSTPHKTSLERKSADGTKTIYLMK
jgi:hypothetical protein